MDYLVMLAESAAVIAAFLLGRRLFRRLARKRVNANIKK